MLVVSAHMCMAINLYKECRGASDKECQLVNHVVINRAHASHQDACSVIFEKNQFSWTTRTPKKLRFPNYGAMIAYYKLNDNTQLIRAFDNVDKSLNVDVKSDQALNNITHYYDRSLKRLPKWALAMNIAYRTHYFIFGTC